MMVTKPGTAAMSPTPRKRASSALVRQAFAGECGGNLPAAGSTDRPGAEQHHAAGDQFFADGVDGRVGHLGKQLAEIVIE